MVIKQKMKISCLKHGYEAKMKISCLNHGCKPTTENKVFKTWF